MGILPCVEIEPERDANASVIWLHGLGANGHDFEPIVSQLTLDASLSVRFVFPHAREIPVTVNNGFIMPAWYDIYEMAIDAKVDISGISRSAAEVKLLIKREGKRGIASKKIALVGFSQGGAVVYESGLTCAKSLAGILGLSTYFATHDTVAPNKANRHTPIEIHHGLQDTVVPEMLGREATQHFKKLGNPVTYKSYNMGHSVCEQQIEDISEWINAVLA